MMPRIPSEPISSRSGLGPAPEPGSRRVSITPCEAFFFCVVHDVFRTDTADYADILLPATTQLEHVDVHNSYGHLYVQATNRAIEPLGEALPNTELFRRLAARMGFTEPCFRDDDDTLCRSAFCFSAASRPVPRGRIGGDSRG